MIDAIQEVKQRLVDEPKTWLITGVAGFIGSNLLEELCSLNQIIVGVDNFSTGRRSNLESVKQTVGEAGWKRFKFIEGDVSDFEVCRDAVNSVDYVLHQAALGSVPRSVENPLNSNKSNVVGFLNILEASRLAKVKSFTYAASSSTYGDHKDLPKIEQTIGDPLSPYAVTKLVNELYAGVYAKTYGFNTIGLRYFNVFGRRQDPNGAYAAVIPRWIDSLIKDEEVFINGDGSTSRDFCYIDNVIQANLLAATAKESALNQVYNVALGDRTSLLDLFNLIKTELQEFGVSVERDPSFRDFRIGDVLHSQASIQKAQTLLGYDPKYRVAEGMKRSVSWYLKN